MCAQKSGIGDNSQSAPRGQSGARFPLPRFWRDQQNITSTPVPTAELVELVEPVEPGEQLHATSGHRMSCVGREHGSTGRLMFATTTGLSDDLSPVLLSSCCKTMTSVLERI